jgi:hypothetical protein
VKPALLVLAVLLGTSASASANFWDALGAVSFARTAQKVCPMTADQAAKLAEAAEATIAEDNLTLGSGQQGLDHFLQDWRDVHVQSAKLLRDAERNSGVARKIVCDTLQSSLRYDPPFWGTPFSFAESGYPKPATSTCAAGFVPAQHGLAPDPKTWCEPERDTQ